MDGPDNIEEDVTIIRHPHGESSAPRHPCYPRPARVLVYFPSHRSPGGRYGNVARYRRHDFYRRHQRAASCTGAKDAAAKV